MEDSQSQNRYMSRDPDREPRDYEPGNEDYYEDSESKNVLYWVGGVILVLAVAVAFFVWGQDRGKQATPGTKASVAADTSGLEGQITAMDGRLGRLEQSVKDIQTRMAQMEKNSALLLAGQKDLSEKINQLGRIASTMPAPAAPKPAPAPAPAPAVSAPKPAPAPNPVATAAPKPAASLTYTVRPGDTLYSIAKKHGLTVDQLKRLNGLKGDSLGVGQELKLK